MQPVSSAVAMWQDAQLACCAWAPVNRQQISCGICANDAGLRWGARSARVPLAIFDFIQSLPSLGWGALPEPAPF